MSRSLLNHLAGVLLLALFSAGCGRQAPIANEERVLLEQLHSGQDESRLHAIQQLGARRSTAAVPLLTPMLGHPQPDVRIAVIEALGNIGAPESGAFITPRLQDSAWQVRAAAAEALGKLKAPASIPHLEQALGEEIGSVRHAAAGALANFGPAGFASLMAAAAQTNEWVSEAALTALGRVDTTESRQTLRGALQNPSPAVRLAAAESVIRLQDDSLLPAIVTLLKDPDRNVRISIEKSLPRFGITAIPALTTLLSDTNEEVRRATVDVVGRIGEEACAPVLLKATTDRADSVTKRARHYLSAQLASGRAMKPVLDALKDPQPAVRESALVLLQPHADQIPAGTFLPLLQDSSSPIKIIVVNLLSGKGDASVSPAIEPLLTDSDIKVRHAAAIGLARIGNTKGNEVLLASLSQSNPTSPQWRDIVNALSHIKETRAVEPLMAVVQGSHASNQVKQQAMMALGRIGDPRAANLLLSSLNQTYARFKSDNNVAKMGSGQDLAAIIQAVGLLGEPRAFDQLAEIARQTNHRYWNHIRAPAVDALVRCDPQRAVPFLAEALKQAEALDHAQHRQLIRLLEQSQDPRAVPAIVIALGSDMSTVTEPAALALVKLATHNPECAVALIQQMKTVAAPTRSAIAHVLAETGQPVFNLVADALKDANAEIRQGAAWAFGSMRDPRAVDLLIGALTDENPHVRGSAAWALGKLGDRRALQPLIARLSDPDLKARFGVIEALGDLGDPQAIPALTNLLKDDDTTIRATAVRSLGLLGDLSVLDTIKGAMNDANLGVRNAARQAAVHLESANHKPTTP